ncbi:hypothetical protein [Mycolicibacterium holsaticum]|uniref:hypothetical protein n=1 Tax=Mycolicibacterium holsaticum TaxID=152142 RepID=UPI001C7DD278|nr:hypothetical protein [Mycolicibacterium holsaticum]MDA4109018.1 hypothetical protein [Mycolicibacterium holsaticum DSM 44478 = JCM 12374]QZA11431.1 hypothetical protein K3U96_19785 [Mycolicibacterium holsaticum DSM 44478 = JCM 12374]UNC11078.1 hypothetical protein H5U41_07040 [Mycolicibacterium holsaticum DSM 44478 = JCM 12374]
MHQSPGELRRIDSSARDAVRFAVVVGVVAVAFLITAAVWVSTCSGATADTVACGAPQRAVLALGAPAILLIGALRAFFRTYRAWRTHEPFWAWQGAGWFLLTLMLLVVTMSLPAVAGPTVFGL